MIHRIPKTEREFQQFQTQTGWQGRGTPDRDRLYASSRRAFKVDAAAPCHRCEYLTIFFTFDPENPLVMSLGLKAIAQTIRAYIVSSVQQFCPLSIFSNSFWFQAVHYRNRGSGAEVCTGILKGTDHQGEAAGLLT